MEMGNVLLKRQTGNCVRCGTGERGAGDKLIISITIKAVCGCTDLVVDADVEDM